MSNLSRIGPITLRGPTSTKITVEQIKKLADRAGTAPTKSARKLAFQSIETLARKAQNIT